MLKVHSGFVMVKLEFNNNNNNNNILLLLLITIIIMLLRLPTDTRKDRLLLIYQCCLIRSEIVTNQNKYLALKYK